MITVQHHKAVARQAVEDAQQDLICLSHQIHGCPELAFAEHHAAGWVADALASHRFAVQRGLPGLPTAVVASFGSGELVIAFCAEFDALPEIGHACGHNIIGAAGVGAGLALASVADDLGVTVKVLGTPAEEHGGGKILMLEQGAFEGIHAVMAIHPGPFDTDYVQCQPLACAELLVTYSGASDNEVVAQAAASAAAALGGLGTSESIDHELVDRSAAKATGRYWLNSTTLECLQALIQRLSGRVEAVAADHGARLSVSHPEPLHSHFAGDEDLESCYTANLAALGRSAAPHPDTEYSTDLGNISLVIPTLHPTVGIESGTAVCHDADFTPYCVRPSADAAVLRGATAMSWTAIDIATIEPLRTRLLDRSGSPPFS